MKMAAIKWIIIFAKVILYVTLFTFFTYFYMVNQMSDFFKRRTTEARQTDVPTIVLEPPTITICLKPTLKTSVAKEYGVATNDEGDFLFKNIPFEEIGYVLNRDYQMELGYGARSDFWIYEKVKVHEGTLMISGKEFQVDSIQTLIHGLCYKVQPQFQITQVPFSFRLFIKSNSSLKDIDQPQKIILFLTSNNTWQGIIGSDWPHFEPTKLTIGINTYYWYVAKSTEYQFQKGIENSEDCWEEQIKYFNCPTKCIFLSLAPQLPQCNTSQDIRCFFKEAYRGNAHTICNQKKRGLTYNGELHKIERFEESSDETSRFTIYFQTMTKEIREEVDVITLSALIGSVGGSLGMFFGFSFSAYALYLLDRCTSVIMAKYQLSP